MNMYWIIMYTLCIYKIMNDWQTAMIDYLLRVVSEKAQRIKNPNNVKNTLINFRYQFICAIKSIYSYIGYVYIN